MNDESTKYYHRIPFRCIAYHPRRTFQTRLIVSKKHYDRQLLMFICTYFYYTSESTASYSHSFYPVTPFSPLYRTFRRLYVRSVLFLILQMNSFVFFACSSRRLAFKRSVKCLGFIIVLFDMLIPHGHFLRTIENNIFLLNFCLKNYIFIAS